MMTVDAIVVSYNTKGLLRACLASLRASSPPLRQIFVVDNASTDGSPEMVAEEFPEMTLVRLQQNLGFARANNAVFAECEADSVLLLNSDAELLPHSLETLAHELAADERVGAVGPMLLGHDGRVQYEGGRRDPSILGEFGNISRLNVRFPGSVFGRYLMSDWDHRSTRDVDALSGACMLLKTSALAGTLFSDDFFMYGEDIELCQRLRRRGWTIRYLGDVEVLHHGAAASSKARTRMRVAGVASMARLLRSNRGPFYAGGYLALVPVAWLMGGIIRRIWP